MRTDAFTKLIQHLAFFGESHRELYDPFPRSKRMSAAPASATVSPFDCLPDELVLKIIKLAAGMPSPKLEFADHWLTEKYDHDLLANCLSQVSMRFKRISADVSLWKGDVWIGRFTKIETIEWVIRNCLNGGTTSLSMPENDDATGYDMFTYRYSYRRRKTLSQIDPHTNYPNMMVKLWRTYGRGRRIWERREAGLLHRLRQRLR